MTYRHLTPGREKMAPYPRRCAWLLSAVGLLSFGVSPLAAQWEVSGGGGVHLHRMSNWSTDRFAWVRPLTYASPAASLAVGYRLHERVGVRGRIEAAEREINPRFNFLPERQFARSLGLGLEGVAYLKPWLSVGAGLTYHWLRPQLDGFRAFGEDEIAFAEFQMTDFGIRSHFAVHAVGEVYLGRFTVRVAPSMSVGRVYGERFTSANREAPLRGSWLGLGTQLLYRVPFGKTRYADPAGFGEVLATAVERGGATTQRWGLGPVVEYTAALLNVGGVGDGYDLRPRRLRLGVLSTYALDEDWRLRLSAGWDKFGSTSRLSEVALRRRRQLRANFRGVDVMVGAERRVWRGLTVAADIGAVKVYEEWVEDLSRDGGVMTGNGRRAFPLVPADNSPLADFIWLADVRADWTLGGRVRLGAHAQVTLSDVNSDSPDALLRSARPRTGGYLGAGVHAAWMVLND